MKTFEYRKFGLENLVLTDRSEPRASAHEVVVKFHAASLNYRDVMFFKGIYRPDAKFPAVPLSDGAGEVIEVGENVTRWKVGDRVCPIFMQGWLEGAVTPQKFLLERYNKVVVTRGSGKAGVRSWEIDRTPVSIIQRG